MKRNVLLTPAQHYPKSAWVIYDHPLDEPNFFVARRWEIRGVQMTPTQETILDTDIEAIRDQFRAKGLTRIKEGGPDPVVIESWM